jgi:TM2 domain-containing membrane protein YozV
MMVVTQRSRWKAAGLAWLGVFLPSPIPLSGLHKFYLGQPVWGVIYLLLGWTQVPRVACAIEGVLLLTQSSEDFAQRWSNPASTAKETAGATFDPAQVSALGVALRELDTLRQEGLISELEFEQKRRCLLDQVT